MGLIDTGVQLTLRLPEDLRDQLVVYAGANNRSMNSEIISILSKWLAKPKGAGLAQKLGEPDNIYNSHAELLKACSSLSVAQAEVLLVFLRDWESATSV